MHALNAILLLLVATSRLSVADIRRDRQKPGRKTDASLTPDYFRRDKQKRRAVAIANGTCVHCFSDKARPGKRTCQGCSEAAKLK